jgi:hypothetical protein
MPSGILPGLPVDEPESRSIWKAVFLAPAEAALDETAERIEVRRIGSDDAKND